MMTTIVKFSDSGEQKLLLLVQESRLFTLPQHTVPQGMTCGSDEHILFLFALVFLTPRTPGVQLAQVLGALWTAGMTMQHLIEAAADSPLISVMKKRIIEFEVCLKQINSYGGMKAFCSIPSVDEFVQIKKASPETRFSGFGPKLYSLFRMTLDEMNIQACPFDAFPVDSHAINMCYQLGLLEEITKKGGRENICVKLLERYIRPRMDTFLQSYQIKPWQLHNAMYLIGSTLCGRCATTSMKDDCSIFPQCPGRVVYNKYNGGFVTRIPQFAPKA
jgi:hypothetical protein